jgi:signal transduction histidine kinase
VINLINNAIDALCNSPDKKVFVRVADTPDGKTQISVVDNGCGIDQELLDKIFVPFFTTKDHGSGIGLSLSRQIMRMHKGTISVTSKPGKQTAFFLRF